MRRSGSWLDMTEAEIVYLMRHGMPALIAVYDEFWRLVSAWEDTRNAHTRTLEWLFALDDARHKLRRHYPKINLDESANECLTNH